MIIELIARAEMAGSLWIMHAIMLSWLEVHWSRIFHEVLLVWSRVTFILFVSVRAALACRLSKLTHGLGGKSGRAVVLRWCNMLLMYGNCSVDDLGSDSLLVNDWLNNLMD